MINSSFVCENCRYEVSKHPSGSARNHCPKCLYGMHLDEEFPGDRASLCKGLMAPIGLEYKKNKGYMIIHECLKCKKRALNKMAPDDEYMSLTF